MPKIDAFGRTLIVERAGDDWAVFDVGSNGTRRPARDVIIPDDIDEAGLVQFLDDLLHEYSRPGFATVKVVKN